MAQPNPGDVVKLRIGGGHPRVRLIVNALIMPSTPGTLTFSCNFRGSVVFVGHSLEFIEVLE